MMTIPLKRTARQASNHNPNRRWIPVWEWHLFLGALLVLCFSLLFLNATLPEPRSADTTPPAQDTDG